MGAGWSVGLLFATRFSNDVGHMVRFDVTHITIELALYINAQFDANQVH